MTEAGLVSRVGSSYRPQTGTANACIAEVVGTIPATTPLRSWCKRYGESGVDGMEDAAHPGQLKHIIDLDIVDATVNGPQKMYGLAH
jgi:hypothetical protein